MMRWDGITSDDANVGFRSAVPSGETLLRGDNDDDDSGITGGFDDRIGLTLGVVLPLSLSEADEPSATAVETSEVGVNVVCCVFGEELDRYEAWEAA